MHVNLPGLVLKDVIYTYMFLSDHLKSAFMCIIKLKFAYLLNVENWAKKLRCIGTICVFGCHIVCCLNIYVYRFLRDS